MARKEPSSWLKDVDAAVHGEGIAVAFGEPTSKCVYVRLNVDPGHDDRVHRPVTNGLPIEPFGATPTIWHARRRLVGRRRIRIWLRFHGGDGTLPVVARNAYRFTGLPRPTFATSAEYAARLGDAAYWAPYVADILRRHGLPAAPASLGSVGSFPTLLVGEHVVKLFGNRFEGAVCFESERTVLRRLSDEPTIPAPMPIAEGTLFGGEIPAQTDEADADWPWPYLVMTRLDGIAWHEAALSRPARTAVARQLGAVLRHLHDQEPPAGSFWARDWLAEWRASCAERQRRYGRLPVHLIDLIDDYLVEPLPERRLVHADLHDHHILVDGGRLVGIIDWGDAVVADCHYELPALHLHTFDADRRLLAAFLDGYGWPWTPDFPRRAMSMTLAYQFDLLDRVTRRTDLRQFPTLDALADYLWRPA